MHTLLGSRRNPRRPNRCSRCNPRSNLYQNETGAVFPKGTAAPVFVPFSGGRPGKGGRHESQREATAGVPEEALPRPGKRHQWQTDEKRFRIHEAELRKLVHNLRVDGAPICSDRTGYFYPANAWEVIATIGHLRRMRDGVEKAIRSLERATGAFRLPGGGEADR